MSTLITILLIVAVAAFISVLIWFFHDRFLAAPSRESDDLKKRPVPAVDRQDAVAPPVLAIASARPSSNFSATIQPDGTLKLRAALSHTGDIRVVTGTEFSVKLLDTDTVLGAADVACGPYSYADYAIEVVLKCPDGVELNPGQRVEVRVAFFDGNKPCLEETDTIDLAITGFRGSPKQEQAVLALRRSKDEAEKEVPQASREWHGKSGAVLDTSDDVGSILDQY